MLPLRHNKVNHAVQNIHLRHLEVCCLKAAPLRLSPWQRCCLDTRWWCTGNILKAMQRDNVEFGENNGDTTGGEAFLSSEMNLLNNLGLMGLSIIFWFCARVYSSLLCPISTALVYCVLLFCTSLYSPSASLSYSLWPSFREFTRLWKGEENIVPFLFRFNS